jgi:hypothetical protein
VISSGAVILLTGAVIWLARVVHAGRIERAALREELTVTVAELNGVRSELTSLSGLLPMCAWCKKIRDEWRVLAAARSISPEPHRRGIQPQHVPGMHAARRRRDA